MKLSTQAIRWTAFTAGCSGIGALLLLQLSSFPENGDFTSASASASRAMQTSPQAPVASSIVTTPVIPEKTEPTTTLLHPDARILANKSLPLDERARAALRLAQAAPDGAREELLRIIEDSNESSRLRAAAAQALAQLDDRESRAIAENLARGEDPNLARAAVRGIASHDQTGTAQFLANLLTDQSSPEAVRMEAALGLASMKSPDAYDALLEASYADLDTIASEPVFHDVLRGLIRNNFNNSGGLINDYLNHPDIDPGTKVVAIDEMAGLEGSEALAALLLQAQSEDPSVREAAAWAISQHDEAYLARDHLLALMEKETSSWVRSGLYEALRYQESIDVDKVWNQVANEQNLSARMTGIKLLADHISADSADRFSSEFVPQLQKIATEDPSLTNRLNAIIALSRANNIEAASDALRQIQKSGTPEIQRAAKLALR